MPDSVTMTDKQKCPVSVEILDEDGQPFAELPDGANVTFVSDAPDIAGVEPGADGLSATITSGKVGTTTVHVAASIPGSPAMADDIAVAIANSAPGSFNIKVGTPVDE